MDVGKEFSSWESFMHALEQYSKDHKVVYTIGTCKPVETANKNDSLQSKFPDKFKYCFARMVCKHYGNYSSRSAGLRPNQRTCKTGCASSILVSVNKKRTALVIKEANLEHSHDVSEVIFSKYPQNRRLQGEERRMASVLLRAGVPLSRVQEFISNTCSKSPTIKDLQNIKTSMKGCLPEKEGHEFAFLADLDQLMAEDPESVVEIINFDLVPGAIYLQTSEMTERMKGLQDGHLQIVTHHLNDDKLSLVSVIGLNKDLCPHILAFCIIIVGAETSFQYFVEAFIRNNSVFCDSVNGVVLDCSRDNVEFLQQLIPQASVAWSRSYILEKFATEVKASKKDVQLTMQLCKDLMNADCEEVYEKKLKELLEVMPAHESKEFLRTWDSYKDMWVQYEIVSHQGLQHQKSAVERDYINSLRVFMRSSMTLSDLIKAVLRLDRSEEPIIPVEEAETIDMDPSFELYRQLCFPEASQAVICQLGIALRSMYEIKEQTDMIFIKRRDNDDEFILDTAGCKCTCRYFMDSELPCEHVFAWLKFTNKPFYNEALIPAKWQVFGKSITLDALAESLAQGNVPSSFQHDERLKELQTVLKDTLTTCCSHSYDQMGKDLILLKQILSIMRNCAAHKAKLRLEPEEDIQPENSAAQTPAAVPRRRGRPSKKDKLQQKSLQSQQEKVSPSPSKPQTPVATTRHNLRANIKHKFVTRGLPLAQEQASDTSSTENTKLDGVITSYEGDTIVSAVLSEDRTHLSRTITPRNDSTDTSLGQLASISPENQLGVSAEVSNSSSTEGKENKVSQSNMSGAKFSKLLGSRHLTDYKQKLQAGYHVNTPRRGRRPFFLAHAGTKRPYSDTQDDSTADDEEDDEGGSESDSSSANEEDLESVEKKRTRRHQELENFVHRMPPKLMDEMMQATSMLESPEERDQSLRDEVHMNCNNPPEVLIKSCKNHLQTVDFIMEQIKRRCTGYDKYAYHVAACLVYRAYQTGAAISDLLQTVSVWPSHLPDISTNRPMSSEVNLLQCQTLTVCGHKLDQNDMDSLKPDSKISPRALHAYLEILAQRHSGKMLVIPFDVISQWRDGRYSESLFHKVHFKTFEYLILPIHCGAEFTESERESGEIVTPCWMALVADVQNKTVGIMNPRTEDKYQIAANGYMLQWRRYMQIRSVHTREMLSSWTTRKLECSKLENVNNSGILLLMNVEALINNIPPVVMTEAHIPNYLHFVAIALRDMDRETTVLCVGGPACEQMAAQDADWLQCENCRTWWHRACAEHSASKSVFYCTSCRQRILSVKRSGGHNLSQSVAVGDDDDDDDDEGEEEVDEGEEENGAGGIQIEGDQEMVEASGESQPGN